MTSTFDFIISVKKKRKTGRKKKRPNVPEIKQTFVWYELKISQKLRKCRTVMSQDQVPDHISTHTKI